jgi:hypothetical protein
VVDYYYRPQPAVDSTGATIARETSGQIFAVTDTTFTTPLTFTTSGGVTGTTLSVSAMGQTAAFKVADHPEVIFKSGELTSPLVAWSSVIDAANAAQAASEDAANEAALSRQAADAAVAELGAFRAWVDLGVTRYNLMPNPRFVGVDSRGGGGSTGWTQEDVETGGPDGRSWSAHTLTADQTGNALIGALDLANGATAGVREGATYSGSAYVRASRATTARIRIAAYDSSDVVIGTAAIGVTVSIPANTWTRLSGTIVAPSGAVKLIVFPEIIGTALLTGDVLGVAQRMLTQGADLEPYFDGGTVTTNSRAYAWEGVPGASRSKFIDMASISSDLVERAEAAEAAAGAAAIAAQTAADEADAGVKTVNGVGPDASGNVAVAGGGGVSSHSALSNLSSDDHPQYLTNARGDSRYYPRATVDTMVNNAAAQNSAADRSRSNHTGTQAISTVAGLQAALDNLGGAAVTSVAGRSGEVVLTMNDITNMTPVGQNVAGASSAAAARSAIGAGTSSLALGTSSTTAMRGNAIAVNPASTSGLPDGTLVVRT